LIGFLIVDEVEEVEEGGIVGVVVSGRLDVSSLQVVAMNGRVEVAGF
jgi:hypothetical protein